MMLRPLHLIRMAVLGVVGVFFLFIRDGTEYVGLAFLVWLVISPIILYRALAKAVDNQKALTGPRTVDFSASRIITSGPDWKTEVTWTHYKGFSEDATYYYMHLSDNGLAAIVPKSALTLEQQQKFREYATRLNVAQAQI